MTGSGSHLLGVHRGGRDFRAIVGRPKGNDVVAVLAVDLHSRNDTVSDLELELAVGSLLLLTVVTALTWWLSHRVLQPVERLRVQAAQLASGGGEGVLDLPRTNDEIGALATTLNELLDRLHESIRRERRFVADAGHELRTPLSLLAAEIEFALEQPRTPEVHEQTLATLQAETTRLAALAEDLLQVGARGASEAADLDLAGLAQAVAARARALAARDGRSVHVDAPGTAVVVHGDASQLDRALTNLVDNAVRHGAGDVRVRVTVDEAARTAQVDVEDAGEGFPPGFADRAFDRFSRGDAARAGGGSGLGLAIVRAIVVAHGGQVEVVERPASGAARGGLLRVRLPLASAH